MSNLEFVTKARKILTEDYNAKHTAEYNSWLAEHKNSWMKPHFVVPFPPFIISSALAPFKSSVSAPNENDVAAKALELYKESNPVVEEVSKPMIDTSSDPVVEEPVVEVVVSDPVVEEPVVEVVVSDPVVEVPVVEVVVSDPVVEVPVVEEPIVEGPVIVEATVVEAPNYTNEIYKIFQTTPTNVSTEHIVPVSAPIDPIVVAVEESVNAAPQPVEELAKVKKSGKILPSVLQKLQDMKSKWTTKD